MWKNDLCAIRIKQVLYYLNSSYFNKSGCVVGLKKIPCGGYFFNFKKNETLPRNKKRTIR